MTRHGTLAYYLAAWIIGCPVAALLNWLIVSVRVRSANSSALFEICFIALLVGLGDALLFALLLRRLMHWAVARSIALWALAGAALLTALMFLFAQVWSRLLDPWQGVVSFAATFLFAGPGVTWSQGWWQAPIEGAGIGAVLGLIDRAFNPAAAAVAPAGPGEREPAPTR